MPNPTGTPKLFGPASAFKLRYEFLDTTLGGAPLEPFPKTSGPKGLPEPMPLLQFQSKSCNRVYRYVSTNQNFVLYQQWLDQQIKVHLTIKNGGKIITISNVSFFFLKFFEKPLKTWETKQESVIVNGCSVACQIVLWFSVQTKFINFSTSKTHFFFCRFSRYSNK